MRFVKIVLAVCVLLAVAGPLVAADTGRRMAPPILSQAGPKAPVMAQPGVPAPTRITPVKKGPGETFAPTAADWAVYLKDSSHSCRIDVNPTSDLTSAWTYVTPGGGQTAFSGSPVESDGIICFTSSDGYLCAVNRNTGAAAWAPVLLGASTYRGGTPVIWQDRVVTEMVTGTGTTSSVFCRSMATGDSIWTTPIPATPGVWNVYLSRPIVLTVSGTPYVFLGCFYSTTTTRILGLNMNTGAIVYDQQWTGNEIIGGLATDGTDLYAPLLTTGVIKIHPGTGPAFDTLWTQHPGPGATQVFSTPVYCNGQVFAAKGTVSGPCSLYAINASTGAINWTRGVGTPDLGIDLGSPCVDGANVYMYASDFSSSPYYSQVMAFNQATGDSAWSSCYQTTDGLTDGGMAITTGTNKRLYIGTGFGASSYGHMIVLNAADGTLEQDLPYATDYIYNSVCRPSGGLYILTYGSYAAGTLIGYNVTDASLASKVMFLTTDDLTPDTVWQAAVMFLDSSYGAFSAVDTYSIETHPAFPAAALYSAGYKAILVYDDYAPADPAQVGDSLAAFIEYGGGVVEAYGADDNGFAITGRFRSTYAPFTIQNAYFGTDSMALVHNPAHPIMAGVTSYNSTGPVSTGNTHSTLRSPNCVCLAEYSVGNRCVAACFDSSSRRAVSLGIFPMWPWRGYPSTGQWVRLFENALLWAGSGGTGIQEPEPKTEVSLFKAIGPNPFRGRALLSYALPRESRVSLRVYATDGRLVRTLADGYQAAGSHQTVWDGCDDLGRVSGHGVYYCRLQAGALDATTKLVKVE